jgi:MFS family permease
VLDRALLAIYVGGIFFTMAVSTVGVWLVPYLMRVHDLPVSIAGVIASIGYGVLGIVGSLAFGIAADAAGRKRTGGMLELLAIGALVNGVATLGLALVHGFTAAMAFLALWGISGYIYAGTANAAISHLAPARSRATAFALYTVLVTLIGTSVGPLLAGMLSDAYQHELGDRSLLPGIGLSAFYQVGSIICFVYAARAWRRRSQPLREPACE